MALGDALPDPQPTSSSSLLVWMFSYCSEPLCCRRASRNGQMHHNSTVHPFFHCSNLFSLVSSLMPMMVGLQPLRIMSSLQSLVSDHL